MARCSICGKGRIISTRGTHKRGVAGGQWKKKAPKSRKIFKPNLHKFQGKIYCVKCLRKVKKQLKEQKPAESPVPKSA